MIIFAIQKNTYSPLLTYLKKEVTMKTLNIFIFLLSFLPWQINAQATIIEKDGIYYNEKSEPFTGIHFEHFEDGSVKMEVSIADGVLDGITKVYYPDGTMHEKRSYKKGKMHGTWITWNEKGSKISEANYMDGNKEGKWHIWAEDGTLLYDMTYKNGMRSGKWRMYDQAGNLVQEKNHNGK